jgi:predicted metal-dependent phosphoesterase TrpH
MMGRADLHTHSVISDGTDHPAEIVRLAKRLGLGGIGLTDHDTLEGLNEFMTAGVQGIQRVPGVELSTKYLDTEAHLIGYYVPKSDHVLSSHLSKQRDYRIERFPKMLARMEELGYDLDPSIVSSVLDGVESPGRPHVASILVKQGFVKDSDEAFEKFLAEGRPAYVAKEKPQLDFALELLLRAGAVPVLAHPLTMGLEDLSSCLQDMKQQGLVGIETSYHYTEEVSQGQLDEVERLSSTLGLVQTGGSDYHGTHLERQLGAPTVPVEVIDQLRKAAHEMGTDVQSWES